HTHTTQFYTLSLHDALPMLRAVAKESVFSQSRSYGFEVAMSRVDSEIASGRIPNLRASHSGTVSHACELTSKSVAILKWVRVDRDRKSTRLNSSHVAISYAV